MTLALGEPIHSSFVVGSAMFGGNCLFLHNLISGENASFNEAIETLGVMGLRFPGGTMTELNFDIDNPDGPPLGRPDGQRYVGITEFLNFVSGANLSPTIVLPTEKMYTGTPDASSSEPRQIEEAYMSKVLQFVRQLLTQSDSGENSYPDVPIQAFEIGNEYWGSGNMTAKEYGQLVNALIPGIMEIFDELLDPLEPRPKILIQMGSPWDSQYSEGIYSDLTWAQKITRCNSDIIDQIRDPIALDGIGGLIEHYYYSIEYDALAQGSASDSYIDIDLSIWERAGFGDLELIISEWGVAQNNSAQFGLMGAGVIIEQMEHMIRLGADSAFAWPIQGWNTSLAGSPNTDPKLTPIGAAFQIMSESIIGSELYENGVSSAGLEINTFGSDHKMVLFVMSRSDAGQQVNLDLSAFASQFSSMSGVKIGVESGAGVNDPSAAAVLTHFSQGDLLESGSLSFFLSAYEVMTVEILLPDGKLYLGTRASEKFLAGSGNDTMSGAGGDDTLIGGRGDDILVGSIGRDVLNGWGGNDTIRGGQSGDVLYGQQDDDLIFGCDGSDIMAGDDGSDVLLGGRGADQLDGGLDSDRLRGGAGRDTMEGGAGSDVFVFNFDKSETGTQDVIVDFEVGVDRIVIRGAHTPTHFGDSDGLNFVANLTGFATDFYQQIIYEMDTGIVWMDLDGAGAGFDRRAIVQVDQFLELTSLDFTLS